MCEGRNPMESMTKEQVEERIADWIRRLVLLYEMLDDWLQDILGAFSERGEVEQLTEHLMDRFDVRARRVPTYAVYSEQKKVLELVPSGLWVIGANGRVNAVTSRETYILVDLEWTEGQPSDWRLVRSRQPLELVQLTRQVFEVLIAET